MGCNVAPQVAQPGGFPESILLLRSLSFPPSAEAKWRATSPKQSKYEVICVSPNTYFAMTPLLAQAATGLLEFRATMEPVRGRHSQLQFYHAWAEKIDLKNKKLLLMPAYPPAFREVDPLMEEGAAGPAATSSEAQQPKRLVPNARGGHSTLMARAPHRRAIESDSDEAVLDSSKQVGHHSQAAGESWTSLEEGREYELGFDKLVIAVGAYNRTFSTKGVREHAWFLKDVQNARSIRWRILECFEQADHPNLTDEQRRALLNFIIVGGGPTGSEFAAELHDLIATDLKRLYPEQVPLARISIVDASPGILNNFDASLSTYAREKFKRDGIDLLLNRKVKAVDKGRLIVEPDGEIPFGLLVWSTGICASPLVKSTVSIAKDPTNQFFLTDDHLRILEPAASEGAEKTHVEGVWGIGDCSQIEGKMLPATAQVASQKGKHLAAVLNGEMDHDTEEGETVFKHKNMGAMASLGKGSAIVDSPNAKAQGRLAWVIWRSAYTWMSLSWRNRILVPFFWTINKVFGRDLTRF